jgi:hypothetical protein
MKKLILMTTAIMAVSTGSFAQSREQQTYSQYPQPVFSDMGAQQEVQQESGYEVGTRRVYPGREAYGRDFGPLTRHPGDYRDAVDRGQWPVGGMIGARSFSID